MAAPSCLCSLAIFSLPLPLPYAIYSWTNLTKSHIKKAVLAFFFSFLSFCLRNRICGILALQTCFVLKEAQGFQCQPRCSKEIGVQGAQLLGAWAFLLPVISSYHPANISVSDLSPPSLLVDFLCQEFSKAVMFMSPTKMKSPSSCSKSSCVLTQAVKHFPASLDPNVL